MLLKIETEYSYYFISVIRRIGLDASDWKDLVVPLIGMIWLYSSDWKDLVIFQWLEGFGCIPITGKLGYLMWLEGFCYIPVIRICLYSNDWKDLVVFQLFQRFGCIAVFGRMWLYSSGWKDLVIQWLEGFGCIPLIGRIWLYSSDWKDVYYSQECVKTGVWRVSQLGKCAGWREKPWGNNNLWVMLCDQGPETPPPPPASWGWQDSGEDPWGS